MISKTIHYIWLGRGKKPKNFGMVFKSWLDYAPGFEIKEWNEENISEFQLPEYYYHSYKNKQWAFASDVLRVFILEKYGGLYLDIDQVLLRDVNILWDKEILNVDLFTAKYHESDTYYGFQFFGSVPHHALMKKMCELYTVDSPKTYMIINRIFSNIVSEEIHKDHTFLQKNKIKIFPQEYFYPLTAKDRTENTYSYHLANTSWIPWWKKVLHKMPFYMVMKKGFISILPERLKKVLFNKIVY